MNPVQKAWVRTFKPFMAFWNEKVATRPGVIGRIGRTFRFGPREYGVHPSTRGLRLANAVLLYACHDLMNFLPFFKHISQRGYYIVRITGLLAMTAPLFAVSVFVSLFALGEHQKTEETLSQHLSALPNSYLPPNALEERTSAHYIEINRHYQASMNRLLALKYLEIAEERGKLPRREQLTKYANPTYTYQPLRDE